MYDMNGTTTISKLTWPNPAMHCMVDSVTELSSDHHSVHLAHMKTTELM